MYRGEVVYFVPYLPCCDIPSQLYDREGQVICAPDGGFTGAGDGKCPDFFELRSDGQKVWNDARVEDPGAA
jgi:hypothetical protein